MVIAVLGIDLGKNVCSVVGLNDGGRVLLRRRLKRPAVVEFARQLPGCVVAMEACCGAHHLGRQLAAQGHEVRLMSRNMSALTSKHRRTTTATPRRSRKRPCVRQCALSR